MWKAQEKLPKSASCPRAGKSSIHRTLLWQNWEGDPGVLVLCFHHHHPPPIPGTALKGAFVQLRAPQVGGHFIPPLPFPLGWDAFSQGPSLARRYATQACGSPQQRGPGDAGWGLTPSRDPFGMFVRGLARTQQNARSRVLLGTCWSPASGMEMQNQRVLCWCTHGTGCRVGMQVPGIGVSPQGCSIAAPLHCTAGLLLSVLLITNHGDKVGAV